MGGGLFVRTYVTCAEGGEGTGDEAREKLSMKQRLRSGFKRQLCAASEGALFGIKGGGRGVSTAAGGGGGPGVCGDKESFQIHWCTHPIGSAGLPENGFQRTRGRAVKNALGGGAV